MKRQIQNKEYWDILIIDCLSGNISEEGHRLFNDWLEESEENRAYFNQMKELWDSSGVLEDENMFDYEKAYSLFVKRINEKNNMASIHLLSEKKRWWKTISTVAAVLIPFLCLSYYTLLYWQGRIASDEKILLQSEIISPKGSTTRLNLSDGTVIWLNSGSSITYTDDFNRENRMLELKGEAYLEVARNEQLPLIVRVGNLNIKVLGTKFNVDGRSVSDEVKVSLLEGSVSLYDSEAVTPVKLNPMETGLFRKDSREITVTPELEKNLLSWMKKELLFNGETFEEIVKVLEHHFEVTIHVHNKALLKRCFGGDFREIDSVDKVLKVMSVNAKFKYTIKDKVIDIY